MKKTFMWMCVAILTLCGTMTSCSDDDNNGGGTSKKGTLKCVVPAFLKEGDKVALISPSYYTSMENVTKTADVLRGWGLEPVIGPNVGNVYAGKYAGTVETRASDLRWALSNPDIKAIICNRGGYGAIQLIDVMKAQDFSSNPKWLVGFSDITTLHEMENSAGVMSIHGTMSSFLAAGGTDKSSTLMRDLLMGTVPRYELPAHPQNVKGRASGVLVGGNMMTFAPVVGSKVDVTAYSDIILFVEEVGESMHNIDRQFNMLKMLGVFDRCRGIVLGEFTDCGKDLDYTSVEAMLYQYLAPYNIPVLCGFPAGHGDVNLPLVMGAPVTLDVRDDGGTLQFDIDGIQREIYTEYIQPQTSNSAAVRMQLAGKTE